jgi:hypothetical protein
LLTTGNPVEALKYAKKAHLYAENLGDVYAQSKSLYLEARCLIVFADYQQAQILLKSAQTFCMIVVYREDFWT